MFRTGDAMIFGVIINDDSTDFTIVTDINGSKKPNIVSKDLYKFKFSDTGVLTDISSELATASTCTAEHPEGCTQEECSALPDPPGDACYSWNTYVTPHKCQRF